MFHLTYLNYATIIIDASAVFLVFGILMQTRFMRRSGREADRLFFRLLITTVVMAVADVGGYLTEGIAHPGARLLQFLSMSVFYAAFIILSMLWFDYCLFKFKNAQKTRKKGFHPAMLPGVLALVVLAVNTATGWIFSIDDQGGYHRGILFIPIYVVLAFYITAGLVMIGRYRTAGKKKLIPLWVYVMPLIVSILVTFVIGEISMAAFGTAVTIAFTHLGTMNEVAEISTKEIV